MPKMEILNGSLRHCIWKHANRSPTTMASPNRDGGKMAFALSSIMSRSQAGRRGERQWDVPRSSTNPLFYRIENWPEPCYYRVSTTTKEAESSLF